MLKLQEENFNQSAKLLSEMMIATSSLIATNVSMPQKKVSDADGALVPLLTTRESAKPHTNAVVSQLENHTTSLAQLISELLIARVTLVILDLKNAPTLMMDHSQISQPALKFATKIFHMLNATE